MPALEQQAPWLTAHLEALAARQSHPATDVPVRHKPLIDQAWQAAD